MEAAERQMVVVEVVSPTNIALVKYWGKHPRYPGLFIPTKSSISLNIASFTTRTRLTAERGPNEVRFSLNGRKVGESEEEFAYVRDFFDRISRRYGFAKNYSYDVESRNNFPTASGFASSASGFSALAVAFARVVEKSGETPPLDDREVSVIARLGSGSAARSVPSKGGLVIWHRGYDGARDGASASAASFAESLYGPDHFAELALICVSAGGGQKKVKSRAGMDESVRTAKGYWRWVEQEERELLPSMLRTVGKRDWAAMFGLVREASDNFHRVCLETRPPVAYLNDTSKKIVRLVGPPEQAAYTFDAGPNAVVIALKDRAKELKSALVDLVGKENVVESAVGAGPLEV